MSNISKDNAKKFRIECIKLIHEFMLIFDPSGSSAKLWEDYFGKFKTDGEFVKEIKRILDNPKLYITPQLQSFNKNAQPKFSNLNKIAKMVDVQLEEYVALPYLNENTSISDPAVTLTKVPVGKLHLKRLQQILRKKNKLTTHADKRDMRTGQVVQEDKGAKISDADMYSLTVIGADPVMKELYGPRADSLEAKEEFYKQIREGTKLPRLSDLPNKIEDKIALNTLNAYILGASLMSDLVRSDYLLSITVSDLRRGKIDDRVQKDPVS
jgi:hypothetical protein